MNKKGFTLIEICIVLLISGFIITGIVAGLDLYYKNLRLERTNSNIATIQDAIAARYSKAETIEEKDFPCPSSLSAAIDTPQYGTEVDCNQYVTLNAAKTQVVEDPGVTGLLPDGTYRIASKTPGKYIRIGAVPFRTLNISSNQTNDGYGNRLIYAVTERVAAGDAVKDYNNTSYPDGYPIMNEGGIGIVDKSNTSLISPPNTALFTVFSAGEDGKGAFTAQGVSRSVNCAGADDARNCAFLSNAPDSSVFMSSARYMAQNNQYFDDLIAYNLAPANQDDLINKVVRCNGKGLVYQPADPAADAEGCTYVKGVSVGYCAQGWGAVDMTGNLKWPAEFIWTPQPGLHPGCSTYAAYGGCRVGCRCKPGFELVSTGTGSGGCFDSRTSNYALPYSAGGCGGIGGSVTGHVYMYVCQKL